MKIPCLLRVLSVLAAVSCLLLASCHHDGHWGGPGCRPSYHHHHGGHHNGHHHHGGHRR